MSENVNKITFTHAKQLLQQYCKEHFPSFYNEPEFEATITHWLLNPSTAPPYFPQEITTVLYKFLYAHCCNAIKDANGLSLRESYSQPLLDFIRINAPFPPPLQHDFTFIDLFAGIGGIRIAFQNTNGKCVFSCEWDKPCQKTYAHNFGEIPYGNIKNINAEDVPDHDVLCAGFPCQPFSLAGVSKKNSLGLKHGFDDLIQGTLFFDIKRILEIKRPKAFFLENVKNILYHDKGKTWNIIKKVLEEELGYVINWNIVDASKWLPQHRERIFIVGFAPEKIKINKEQIQIPLSPANSYKAPELSDIVQEKVDAKFTIGPGTWATLERHKAHHAQAGNGFGYGLHTLPIPKGAVTRTMSARYHKDGAEILIAQLGNRPRKLTIEEAMQLQGFNPKKFTFPVSATQAYKQLGNSVAIPAVAASAKCIAHTLTEKTK